MRTDSHGNLLWVKQYSNNYYTWKIFDNGDSTFTIYMPSAMLVHVDANGEIIDKWGYWFGAGGGTMVTRSPAGDYFFAGQDLMLMKVDGRTLDPLWLIQYDYLIPKITPSGLELTPDGGVVIAGSLDYTTNSTELLKVDSDGNVKWARRYESPSWATSPLLAVAPDGDLLLAYQDSHEDSAQCVLMRLDSSSGAILWQEELTFPDYPDMRPARITSITASDDGSALLAGRMGSTPLHNYPEAMPILARLDPSGMPEWCQLYHSGPIHLGSTLYKVLPARDAYVFLANGDQGYERPGIVLSSVDLSGNSPDDCPSNPVRMTVRATEWSSWDCPVTHREWSGNFKIPITGGPFVDVKGIRDDVLCGDVFPAVLSATALQNPFRLKLTGWNFQEGSTAFIDGVTAPSSTFKGAKAKTGQTSLVVGGGSQLKAILPKGQSVCITVQNPDGHTSECFTYTR